MLFISVFCAAVCHTLWQRFESQWCARFGEFWLFFTESVSTLPIKAHKNLHTNHQNEHTPAEYLQLELSNCDTK